MAETFYRVHHDGANAEGGRRFCADNAYSTQGERIGDDPGRVVCTSCLGEPDPDEGCRLCDGTGVEHVERGYSCTDNPEDLLNYFWWGVDDDPVVVFTGALVGFCEEGFPRAVPEQVTRWTTLGELRQEAA